MAENASDENKFKYLYGMPCQREMNRGKENRFVPLIAVSVGSRRCHFHAHWLGPVLVEQHYRSSSQLLRRTW